MPVTIDEVTAEVSTPEGSAQPAPRAESQPAQPSELRRQNEQYERRCQRAARVMAD
jgi:hypothetical protein